MSSTVRRSALAATTLALLTVAAAVPTSGHAKIVSEDEDAFVQIAPAPGQDSGWGTGWANQVISTKKSKSGKVVGNVTTGWLTVYGLTNKSAFTLAIAKGKCGSQGARVSSTRRITTDAYGGWHGKYEVSLGKAKTWVVRGGYRVDVREPGGPVVACGMLRDDPDVGN